MSSFTHSPVSWLTSLACNLLGQHHPLSMVLALRQRGPQRERLLQMLKLMLEIATRELELSTAIFVDQFFIEKLLQIDPPEF